MKYIFTSFALFLSILTFGQSQVKTVLFLGNSYTDVNNLPQMTADVAASMGDTLIFDSNCPGGFTLQGHVSDNNSTSKISSGNWDYVVLQEQSQLPSFPAGQVETDVFPYARILDSLIHIANPCTETVFYMTWGRKNGDASNCAFWPPVCTYEGMDSLLNLRYRMMADSNHALLSPVGAVWHQLRQDFPSIELYQSDESHPTIAGTYAAACTFYTVFFRKDPSLIPFSSALNAGDAAAIRNTVKLILYDNMLNCHVGQYDPQSGFSFQFSASNQVAFTNTSSNSITYLWDFGDGSTSTDMNPIHPYTVVGAYTVSLIASKCIAKDTSIQTVTVLPNAVNENIGQDSEWTLYPNPAKSLLCISLKREGRLSYQLFSSTAKVILSSKLSTSNPCIYITTLASGFYFIQIYIDDKSYGLQPFVKE